MPQLEYIRKHLRYSQVEAGGDLLIQIGTVKHCSCQGRRLENDHFIFGRHFANTLGKKIGALGNQYRRAGVQRVVLQGHREMGRVSDHHVRLGHLAHHPPLGHFPLQLANPALYLWLAFGILEFITDFLLGHLQLLRVVPYLKRNIDCCN